MDKLAFSVYDSKAEYFSTPFFVRSRGEALRSFQVAANDKQTSIGLHPEDFTLFQVGSFDETKGVLTPAVALESLGLAIEYVNKGA